MTVAPGVYRLQRLIKLLTGLGDDDALALCSSCVVNGDPHPDMTNPLVMCYDGTVTLSIEADYPVIITTYSVGGAAPGDFFDI